MATPTHVQKEKLGPAVEPFDRSPNKATKSLQRGETLKYTTAQGVYDATNNNYPAAYKTITLKELEQLQNPAFDIIEKKYLWIIDDTGVYIIPESTFNPIRPAPKQYVCHTNLTGGATALQGGELYFCEDGALYINNKSDRYGCFRDGRDENAQRIAVLEYFRSIYTRVFYLY